MKNLRLYIVLAFVGLVTSCSEDDKVTVEIQNTVRRGAVLRTVSTESSSFNILDTEAFWEVTIEEQDHEDGDLLSNVEVYAGFVDNTPDNGTTTKTETLLKSVAASAFSSGPNGLPRVSIKVTLAEVTGALGLLESEYEGGDQIAFRLLLNLSDGNSFTDIDATGRVSGGSFFSSPYSYRASLVCPSDLAGDHPYVSSNLQAANGNPCPVGDVEGTVTFTDQGGGTYLVSDLGFGQYPSSCWSDGPATSVAATFVDACGLITSGGLDQYGLTYIWVITDVTGSELSINWSNDYGDSGDVIISREGGADWPDLFTQ
ncbi:hypothetical protein [Flagellimonas sp. S3867]|uniref:hypothetical protein n=1 Tax=Flagellimonas sp. S3867 TaxID=2768063 RepID=UPI0016843C95|nr:hypothetical protein [Flagellimonas sp. S3867]